MEYPTYLIHYGIPGQKWGNRRWQYEDGRLTPEGYIHYGYGKHNNVEKISSSIKIQVEKDKKEPTGNQNCQLCTWATEAQFRGISNAVPRPVYSPRDPALKIKGETIVKNPKKEKFKDFKDMVSKINSSGKDARYYMHVNWANSTGGHEFLVIRKNGKNYIMDSQAGLVKPLSEKSEYFSNINFKNSYMARLDNKEFNKGLFEKVNDRKRIVEFDPKKDIPYMRREGMISKEDYKTEMEKLRTDSIKYKLKNYSKTVDSLSEEEYRLFSDGGNRKEEKKFVKEYAKTLKDHPDSRVFISKYGNVTMASIEINGLGDKEWNIGWATNPKARGTGVTQANVKEAISIIREHSNLPITAVIERENIASQKTAEKAGFKDAGYTRMNDNSIRKRYVYN